MPDDRSALARATQVASNVTSVSLEMVLPILIGYWIDQRLGTKAVFAILGGVLGLATGIWSLMRMTESLRGRAKDRFPPK
jgi:F0F1-type ATP synthase assembly protein I